MFATQQDDEEEDDGLDSEPTFECPFCFRQFPARIIDEHAGKCVNGGREEGCESDVAIVSPPPAKRQCQVDLATWCGATNRSPTSSTTPKTSKVKTEKISPFFADAQQAKLKKSPPGISPPGLNASAMSSGVKASCSSPQSTAAKPKVLGPLAERVRPKNLSSFFGQEHILGTESQLRKLINSGEVKSMIMWGPPGCGKTSLAKVIAGTVKEKEHRFTALSAATSGINDVKDIVKHAKTDLQLFRRKTILFLDEIHRFNKLQQDIFLPHVEDGTITLIGATTENPSFALNSALLSRCRVVVMNKLEADHVQMIIGNALNELQIRLVDGEKRQRGPNVTIEKSAVVLLSNMCDGDARSALNCLEYCVQSKAGVEDRKTITDLDVKESLQRSHLLYDKNGEEHYNCISALHKSMRGHDANAALYWLGRMLEGGEDPLYVARRLVRFSSEDIGLADPNALVQSVAAYQACHSIGMPECDVILAQCVAYLSKAPKSTAVYGAYQRVKSCIASHEGPLPGVPLHLRNAPTKLMKDIGYGKGYKYNPSFKGPVVQQYMPDGMESVVFFH